MPTTKSRKAAIPAANASAIHKKARPGPVPRLGAHIGKKIKYFYLVDLRPISETETLYISSPSTASVTRLAKRFPYTSEKIA